MASYQSDRKTSRGVLMIKKVTSLLEDAIRQRIFPGCAIAIIEENKKDVLTFGKYTYDSSALPVNENSIFDVASITKAIPVSSLALKLIELNKLNLDEPMVNFIPEYNGNYRTEIKVCHLLTQTLSFSFRLSECKNNPPDQILNCILNANLQAKPGQFYSYANATSILLGMVIERSSGLSLESAAKQYFFDPLEMDHTSFYPENFDRSCIVPTEIDKWRNGIVQGEVHDESAWALRPMVVGSAGLFSTIRDLSNFAQMLINEGNYRNNSILNKDTIKSIYQNQYSDSESSIGLGWELNQPETMGQQFSKCVFGKTGFTGCSIAISPLKKRAYIMLSNYLYPERRKDRSSINQIRRKLAEIILN